MTDMLRGQASKLHLYLTIIQTETAAAESASRTAEAAVQAMRGDQHTASLAQIVGMLTGLRPQTTCVDQSEIVERLARLAMEDTRTVEVDDYESIVADVQELLKATLDEKTPLQEPEKNTSWRKALAPGEFSRDVGRFRKLFAMASRLSINGGFHDTNFRELMKSTHGKCSLSSLEYTQTVNLNSGAISLSFLTTKSRSSDSASETFSVTNRLSYTSFNARLTFRPHRTRCVITAMVSMIRASGFDASLPSRIVVSPIIPSSSLVFQMVQNGSLGELKSLLASGQANVRSQDEDGHTLLHYAMRRRVTDPEVSRFLIDCGLDTNATPTKQKFASPLYDLLLLHTRETARDVVYANAKLLLEGGADPFLAQDTLSPVYKAIRLGRGDILRNMATNWVYFPTDFAKSRGRGLLETAINPSKIKLKNHPHIAIEILAPILDMGASVHDRSRYRSGWSCLHLAVHFAAFWGSNVERNAIIYLVRRGADVRAKCDRGTSVTDVANVTKGSMSAGSYIRDLWDAVLAACGYDLHEFPRDYPYRPRWGSGPGKSYGMSDLQRLWEGKEHLCPYSFCSECPSSGIDYDHELHHILQDESPWVGERQKALAESWHRESRHRELVTD